MTSGTRDDDGAIETRQELARLSLVVASAFCVALAGYFVPSLARFRPWVRGEGVPIVRLFQEAQALPTFAEPSEAGAPAAGATRLAGAVGGGVARSLEEEGGGRATRRERGESSAGPALRIEPSEYEGITQRIENPDALSAFFRALARTARGERAAVTRVAHYGDSAVAADEITQTARRRMQERFGDAGHGFMLVARGDMHYLHRDIRHRSSGDWTAFSVVRRELGDDWYGYGGVQLRGSAGAQASFATVEEGPIGRRVSSFEVFYQRHRGGGSLRLQVDGERRDPIDTRAEKQEDAWAKVALPDGPHTLTLQAHGGGQTRVYGVALERDGPGVVYDSLGLVGAVADRLLDSEREHVQRQIAHRAPDLLVLGFGGNEAANAWIKIPSYEESLEKVVDHMRAGRKEMSCLLFGPLDQAERDDRGRIATVEALPQIVEAQRRVAKKVGCAFFDTFAAMGGEGAMQAWYRSRPRLATSDFRHATPTGYAVVGAMYFKALLAAFAEHLERSR